jgi:hypothetical protein
VKVCRTLFRKEIYLTETERTKTMTFTARSAYEPEKTATFTLQNGNVAIEFGDALMRQAEDALEAMSGAEDDDKAHVLQNVAKPAVSASLQKIMEPFALRDFSAELDGDSLQAHAWVRAGGLRLAPVMLHWQHVDNPEGAAAFVAELERRQAEATAVNRYPGVLDYWAIWLVAAVTAVLIPILFWRQRQQSS